MGAWWQRRLLLVTGKGGVGKSTVSAALAKRLAAQGRRVLAAEVSAEIGGDSNLYRALGVPGVPVSEPRSIGSNLFGVRVHPSAGHRLFLKGALKVGILVDAALKSSALNRFLMAAPAFPEVGTLYHLVSLLRDPRFDHVVVDLPATGHALQLFRLPKVVLRIVPSGLVGDAIREGLSTMTDPQEAGAVVVTLPEVLPVSEALELVRALDRTNIPMAAAVLNHMPKNPFTEPEREALQTAMARGQVIRGAREVKRLERALASRDRLFRGLEPEVAKVVVPHAADASDILTSMGARLFEAEEAPDAS